MYTDHVLRVTRPGVGPVPTGYASLSQCHLSLRSLVPSTAKGRRPDPDPGPKGLGRQPAHGSIGSFGQGPSHPRRRSGGPTSGSGYPPVPSGRRVWKARESDESSHRKVPLPAKDTLPRSPGPTTFSFVVRPPIPAGSGDDRSQGGQQVGNDGPRGGYTDLSVGPAKEETQSTAAEVVYKRLTDDT